MSRWQEEEDRKEKSREVFGECCWENERRRRRTNDGLLEEMVRTSSG